MNLYYTGANEFLGIQQSSILSLGGFISNSLIPNGSLGNLFGGLSKKTLQEKTRTILGIAFKNNFEENKKLANLKITLIVEDILTFPFIVKVGKEIVKGDDFLKGYSLQTISNKNSIPYNVEFVNLNESIFQVEVDFKIDYNKYIGLWFIREIDESKLEDFYSNEKLIERFSENQKNKKEDLFNFNVEFEFDLED